MLVRPRGGGAAIGRQHEQQQRCHPADGGAQIQGMHGCLNQSTKYTWNDIILLGPARPTTLWSPNTTSLKL